ncbi:unnamed protein product, partial [Ectocarpus sp. 4 AP-2014]
LTQVLLNRTGLIRTGEKVLRRPPAATLNPFPLHSRSPLRVGEKVVRPLPVATVNPALPVCRLPAAPPNPPLLRRSPLRTAGHHKKSGTGRQTPTSRHCRKCTTKQDMMRTMICI